MTFHWGISPYMHAATRALKSPEPLFPKEWTISSSIIFSFDVIDGVGVLFFLRRGKNHKWSTYTWDVCPYGPQGP